MGEFKPKAGFLLRQLESASKEVSSWSDTKKEVMSLDEGSKPITQEDIIEAYGTHIVRLPAAADNKESITRAYYDLYDYVKSQCAQARKNQNQAEIMNMPKIAVHYRVAETCYEDIQHILEFLAEDFGIEGRE